MGQPRPWRNTSLAHDSQKRWSHGTNAMCASRSATRQTSQQSSLTAAVYLVTVQLRWRWHKLLLIDRNSLVIIYVVKLRLAFHTSSFPRFPVSSVPPAAKRSRVFQSCNFHPCSMVPRFPVSRFPFSHFQRPLTLNLAGGFGKRCRLPQLGRGWSPGRNRNLGMSWICKTCLVATTLLLFVWKENAVIEANLPFTFSRGRTSALPLPAGAHGRTLCDKNQRLWDIYGWIPFIFPAICRLAWWQADRKRKFVDDKKRETYCPYCLFIEKKHVINVRARKKTEKNKSNINTKKEHNGKQTVQQQILLKIIQAS